MSFTCPFCYDTHELKDCPMRCSFVERNGVCPDSVPLDSKNFVDKKYYKKCLKCTRAKKDFYCPMSFSGGGLPQVIPLSCIQGISLPISLVGATATGKSQYIGVLVDQIRRRMTSAFNCSITMNANAVGKELYEQNYRRPLYVDKTVTAETDTGQELPAMIFPIDFMKTKKRVTLTIYDTAGENFNNEDNMRNYTGYLSNSKGMILLLDPLQITEIRDKIGSKIPLPPIGNSAVDILDRVVDLIEGFTNNKRKFDINLAVTFTKMDAFDDLGNDIVPEDSCLRYDSLHVSKGVFSQEEFESTKLAMEALLENFLTYNAEFRQKLQRFKNYAFFGVSALGYPPDANGNLRPEGPQPRRVLDPLLWLLAQNKYIPSGK